MISAKFRAAASPEPASWVVAGVRGFGRSVLSMVPQGFEEYLRVFHPAYRSSRSGRAPVSWADIARANGRRSHAGMQLGAITGSERYV